MCEHGASPVVTPRNYRNATLINCGLGTTGTWYFFRKFCQTGRSAFHWSEYCNSGNSDTRYVALRFARIYNRITHCVERASHDAVCTNYAIMQQLDSLLAELRTTRLAMVSDVPIPNLCPFIARNVVLPIIVLTERPPMEWAQRRVQSHRGRDITCRFPPRSAFSAFDIWNCLTQSSPNEYVSMTFISHFELVRSYGWSALARSFQEHNRVVERIAMDMQAQFVPVCLWNGTIVKV
jgi:hypothetical protein